MTTTTHSTLEATDGFSENMSARTKPIIVGIVILLVLAGLTSYLLSQKESRQGAAQTALYLATKTFTQEAKAPEAAVETRFKGAIEQLSGVSKKFSGTRAAYEAELKLGDLYLDHGQPEKSLEWYEKASQSAPRKLERMLAFYSLAYGYESSEKYADALKALEKAQNQGEGLRGEILLSTARVQSLMKDNAKAIATYDQVISQFPGSEYAKTAETQKTFVK